MAEIQFRYQPPTSGKHLVGLAGDFTGWEILDMNEVGGVYFLNLHIDEGRYCYKFIVDGNWIPDPDNPLTEPDPFGGFNSVLIVQETIPSRFSWEEIIQDLSLLDERKGYYVDLNRISDEQYELRFNWFPSLPADLIALIDGVSFPLYRLGITGNQEVFHCLFTCPRTFCNIKIKIQGADNILFWGAEGFSFQEDGVTPYLLELSNYPIFSVPEWVSHSVIYQIFPDRFCNGDPSNDPDFSEDYYKDCRTPPPPGEYLPAHAEYFHLVEDWYDISYLKQSPWLPEGKPDWWCFYGGDIEGVRQKLPYLKDLGVNLLYFNPLWQAKSNHKYDAADFKKVDPHFATEDEMKAFVKEAHQNGMKIILDVAFNHTGEAFWAFRDVVEKGPNSPYWLWYDWYKWPLPNPLPPDFNPREYYQCWWGIKDMPDLNYDLSRPHPAENYVRDINKAVPNRSLVNHILECVQWWLMNIDIDGFRLDIPNEVPYWFWELFRQEVRAMKPDAWLVGEIWHSGKGWVNHHYFDSVMNYAYFKDPVLEFFILGICDKKNFCARIENGLAQYPIQGIKAMMNLLGSHDTIRILELANGDVSRLKLALLFQMTFIGAPHIYYGDEIAMLGGKDPDNRRPFNWKWEENPVAIDLREYYKNLIKLRLSNPLLMDGEFRFLPAPEGLLAWRRYNENGRIDVVLNYGREKIPVEFLSSSKIIFTLGEIEINSTGSILYPNSGIVYISIP